MRRRRYKPTFLLRCIVLACVIAVALGIFALASALGSGLPVVITLGIGAILFFMADLIASSIVALLPRQAEPSNQKSLSLWFTDTERAKRQEAERFHEDTKDNPTLR